MKQKIIDEFGYFAEYAENQAGVKGDLIWDTDFDELAERLVKLFAIPVVTQRSELLLAMFDLAQTMPDNLTKADKMKVVNKFIANNCG